MSNPLKNKKGFTMVELTVTMLILAIAMGLAATLILSGGGLLAKDSEINAAKYVGDAVFSWVENRVRFASHMALYKDGEAAPEGGRRIYVEDGRLGYNDGAQTLDVFGSEFYLGNTVRVYAAKAEGYSDLLELRVEVINGAGAVVYSTESTVKLVNITLENGNQIKAAGVVGETPLLLFDYDRSDSGGYSDPEVNDLAAVCQRLADAIKRLKEAGKLEQIEALTGTKTPGNFDYIKTALADIGGSWPAPSDIKLGGSSHYLKPYFIIKNGVVSGVVYYADSNTATDKNASTKYLYDTRADCWYTYDKNFKLNESDGFSSYDALLDWVESGAESTNPKIKGTWSKL